MRVSVAVSPPALAKVAIAAGALRASAEAAKLLERFEHCGLSRVTCCWNRLKFSIALSEPYPPESGSPTLRTPGRPVSSACPSRSEEAARATGPARPAGRTPARVQAHAQRRA